MTFELWNNCGTAMGTLTWDATHLLQSARTNPPNGGRQAVTLRFDGTIWVEVGRSG